MRIGFGYDSHVFDAGRPLRLGGVTIPDAPGLRGHSDADVLVHALVDALYGAAALGDIGQHFPDSDAAYKNIDSTKLLAETRKILAAENFRVVNVDSIIVAQKPKLSPYISEMRRRLAEILQIETGAVSVKATTEERLGFTGAELGIAAYAVCAIER